MKIMIVVTHLLGTGHLARAVVLARAMMATGHAVRVVSGGGTVAHLHTDDLDFVQLLAVKSDGVDFSRLLTPDGTEATQAYLHARQTQLLQAFDTFAADVLITELFPFGRRILRDEFSALLQHAQAACPKPLICASIRDILAPPSKQKKADFAAEMITAYYDAVLVHADPTLMPLELSWPVSPALSDKLRYTGFVAPPPAHPHPLEAGKGDVIVSAGGGDVGDQLYACAVAAARLDPETQWRLLFGGAQANTRVAACQADAPPNVIAEQARPDFRQILYHAAASVSFCGYNTALDILQAGTPAVFVPFDAGNEVEQAIRARQLAQQPGITALPSAALTPQNLLSAVKEVRAAQPRAPKQDALNGAATTVDVIAELMAQHP